jgi:hypothetical protein
MTLDTTNTTAIAQRQCTTGTISFSTSLLNPAFATVLSDFDLVMMES